MQALMLVDAQCAFHDESWGKRNNHHAEDNMRTLLAVWRDMARPVIHVHHTSESPDSLFYVHGEGVTVQEGLEPQENETVFQKTVNSAFIGTDLERWLRANGIGTVVIAGLTTQHCISTTARMSGNLGFHTYVVSDATAAFELRGADGTLYDPHTVHTVSLATLHHEFARVITTEELLTNVF
ncbi:cysteine hydrolase family protein [Alkalicoccus luteus]|uniref:Cysteine hydrolase n=1 Tax=Alkalicoccus luteus TaxID=1237094 RepID=A0A969PXT3_9BACI|nr:cysteine hydrolase family protein [Alkalicoccus luteus]NJP37562.1 cysteine hydrolase [Alkalicoccus luteus]